MQSSRVGGAVGPYSGFSFRGRRFVVGETYRAKVTSYREKPGTFVRTAGRDGIHGLIRGEALSIGETVLVRITSFYDAGDGTSGNDGIRVEFEKVERTQPVQVAGSLGREIYGTVQEKLRRKNAGHVFLMRPLLGNGNLVAVPRELMTDADYMVQLNQGFAYRGTGVRISSPSGIAEIACSVRFVAEEGPKISEISCGLEHSGETAVIVRAEKLSTGLVLKRY